MNEHMQNAMAIDRERIDRHREAEFVESMIRRFRGKTISINEAFPIIQEMILHMMPEEGHKMLYEIQHRLMPEIERRCHDRYIDRHAHMNIMKERYMKVGYATPPQWLKMDAVDQQLDELLEDEKADFIEEGEMKV